MVEASSSMPTGVTENVAGGVGVLPGVPAVTNGELNATRRPRRGKGAAVDVTEQAPQSRFKGVYYVLGGRWESKITFQSKTRHIGTFDTELEAAFAFDAKAHQLGVPHRANFIYDADGNVVSTQVVESLRGMKRGRHSSKVKAANAIAELDDATTGSQEEYQPPPQGGLHQPQQRQPMPQQQPAPTRGPRSAPRPQAPHPPGPDPGQMARMPHHPPPGPMMMAGPHDDPRGGYGHPQPPPYGYHPGPGYAMQQQQQGYPQPHWGGPPPGQPRGYYDDAVQWEYPEYPAPQMVMMVPSGPPVGAGHPGKRRRRSPTVVPVEYQRKYGAMPVLWDAVDDPRAAPHRPPSRNPQPRPQGYGYARYGQPHHHHQAYYGVPQDQDDPSAAMWGGHHAQMAAYQQHHYGQFPGQGGGAPPVGYQDRRQPRSQHHRSSSEDAEANFDDADAAAAAALSSSKNSPSKDTRATSPVMKTTTTTSPKGESYRRQRDKDLDDDDDDDGPIIAATEARGAYQSSKRVQYAGPEFYDAQRQPSTQPPPTDVPKPKAIGHVSDLLAAASSALRTKVLDRPSSCEEDADDDTDAPGGGSPTAASAPVAVEQHDDL